MPSKRSQQFKIGMLREGATRMSCVNAHCDAERNGWVTVLDPTVEKHVKAANWIKNDTGRRYIELDSADAVDWVVQNGRQQGITDDEGKLIGILQRTPPGMVVFIFPPGQQCFRPHLDREVVFVHQTPRETRVHTRPVDWNEHFNEEADRLNRVIQRG